MKYSILLTFLFIPLIHGCTDIQQELGLSYIEPIYSEKLDLNNELEVVNPLVFDKESTFYMRFSTNLINSGGSNPDGGQVLSGKYILYSESGEVELEQNFKFTFERNVVGGTLFEINAAELNNSSNYQLKVVFQNPSSDYMEYYDTNISIYLRREPSNPIVV